MLNKGWSVGDFARFVILGLAAIGLELFFEFFIRLDGEPLWALYLALTGGSVNLLLDSLLIARLDMGIRGAGIATTAGIIAAISVGIYYFLFRAGRLKFRRPTLEWRFLGRAVTNGSSEMVTELSSGAKALASNIVLLSRVGEARGGHFTLLLLATFLFSDRLEHGGGSGNKLQLRCP